MTWTPPPCRQVIKRARDRCYSRAVSALSAAQTAPPDEATMAQLRALHPAAEGGKATRRCRA
ncbi:hypothetical protein DIPPA_24541 [Diplonema papillatum]|nr:hypothetical protein DIPPA_24541 [Diplonema papillatum]